MVDNYKLIKKNLINAIRFVDDDGWLALFLVEKTFERSVSKKSTPLIVAKMISFTRDKRALSSVVLMPSL
jgi:hypothetical protein